MSIFSDIARAVKRAPKQAKRAVGGVTSKHGIPSLLLHAKVAKAVKRTGAAAANLTNNHVIQAAFPSVSIPGAIVTAAATKGPKGALSAVKNLANNPIFKAELAALPFIFPPAAPISAAGIAAMEGTSRIVDGIQSKDPKKIAQAAMQVGATQLAAKAGDANAARALQLMRDVQAARKVAKVPAKVASIVKGAKAGNKKAQAALHLVQHQKVREAAKVVEHPKAPKKAKMRARETLARAQKHKPGLATGVLTALKSPKGVRVGDFTLLGTGRVLYKGKPIRKSHAA